MKFYKLILGLSIILLVINCNDRYEKISYYDTGEIKEKFEYPSKLDYTNNQNYTAFFYYKNGKIKNYATFRNGKRENEYLSYYPNGALKQVIMFKDGVKNGIQRDFKIDGEIIEEELFINNVPLIRMKSYTVQGERIKYYYYVEKDTIIENGRLIYNNQNQILPERSFYYNISAKDTITLNEEYYFELKVYTYGNDNVIKKFLIGDFDENYNFIDSTKLIKLESKNNSVRYSLKPTKKGNNLIMGKIYVEGNAIIGGKIITQSREFIFCTYFYVTE